MLCDKGAGVKREPSAGADLTYNIGASTATAEGFDEEREWVRSFWATLEPDFTTVYVNILMDEGKDLVREAYGAGKYERLRR
jgi:hypothetical protein